MPKGLRYRLKIGDLAYDMSPAQFEMLSKPVFKLDLPISWGVQQGINGLRAKKLISETASTKKSITYKRSEVGKDVYSSIVARNKETKQRSKEK